MQLGRKLSHIIQKVPLGLEHFLAMFPATVLVPLVINNSVNADVIDTSLVLFTSGIGTIIFLVITPWLLNIIYKKYFGEATSPTIPAYLGSSFAYIGLTIYLLDIFKNVNINPHLAYSYVVWSYLFSGIFIMILSCLFVLKKAKYLFSYFMPTAVMGPAISLIGLDLAESAMKDAGFIYNSEAITDIIYLNGVYPKIVAGITLGVIIFATLLRRKVLKNVAIVFGVAIGFFFAWIFSSHFCGNEISLVVFKANVLSIPRFNLLEFEMPPNLFQLIIVMIPATLVVYTENIGRVTVISRMTDNNNEKAIFSDKNIPKFRIATLLHGFVLSISAMFGSVPNTLYAENIAVMGTNVGDKEEEDRYKKYPDSFAKKVHSRFSRAPYFIAAVIAIIVSFSGHLQQLLVTIPTPVLGGVKLFLFGIIAAPGIQLLVDQNVNYKKISNQLLTASVLISGVSGLEIPIGELLVLKGMSLGFAVGIVVNLIIKIFDYFGRLNDIIELEELFQMCINKLEIKNDETDREIILKIDTYKCHTTLNKIKALISDKESFIGDGEEKVSLDTIKRMISEINNIEMCDENHVLLKIVKEDNFNVLYIPIYILENDDAKAILIDYKNKEDRPIKEFDNKYICIYFGCSIPWRKIHKYFIKPL